MLIEPGDFRPRMTEVLGQLGRTVDVDRVYLFENHTLNGGLFSSQTVEWTREGVSPQILNPILQNMSYETDLRDVFPDLSAGRPFCALIRDLDRPFRDHLVAQDILSFALVPFFYKGEFNGFLGFDDCRTERLWDDVELDSLRAVALGIGGACVRERIERSVQARTEELTRSRRVALSLMEDAQNAVRAAEEASQAKSSFLAMMSHEIRTPLNGVIGFTDLLLADTLSPHQVEIVSTIRQCGDSLLGLISDILDLSRIESGKLELDFTPCSPRDSLGEIAQSFTPALQQKALAIHWEVDASLPDSVITDGKRLRQILVNLIGNAIKFTERGSISIRLAAQENEHGILTGTVSDTGIGMSEEEQSRIFDAFSQAHANIHQQFGGSGLGLAICRRLTRAMGGDISVQSQPGHGTTFTFNVPVQKAKKGDFPLDNRIPQPQRLDPNLRILVVDDIPTNVKLTRSILRRLGCEAEAAGDGNEALALVKETAFDFILMDVLMPHCDGIAATRKIRDLEKDLPARRPAHIIAVTADAFPENRVRCLAAGMNDFLTKPLRIEDISAALAKPGITVR
jgi:signal transduction histidine kinase/ActR/RegA family two-component response regulator